MRTHTLQLRIGIHTGLSVCLSVPSRDRSRGMRHIPIRYDTRCYFNVRSKADMSQLNLPHGTDN